MVKSLATLEKEFAAWAPKSRKLFEGGKNVMPGGAMKSLGYNPPMYVERAQDCYLWDVDGHKLVDWINNACAMILGHSPKKTVKALNDVVNNGIVFGAPNTYEKAIAEHLCKRVPSVESVRFVNSGTEALMNTIRLVRAYTGKPKIAKFEGGFHGTTDDAEISVAPPADAAGSADAPNAVADLKGINPETVNNVVVMPYNDAEAVDLILRENKDDIAAVFYDPKSANYEIPFEFVRFVANKCKELGILFVVDEVKSLRVAYGGYQALAGVNPDLTTFGKLVGGGMPVGAFGGKKKIMDVLDPEKKMGIASGGTYSANPMTLAAGLAHMEEATPDVYKHLKAIGKRMADGLETVVKKSKFPGRVLYLENMITVHMTTSPVRNYRDILKFDQQMRRRMMLAMTMEGHYCREMQEMTVSSPMTNAIIDDFIADFEKVVAAKE
ncbi:MAG: aspartate aminotransferase family protein [SAR202 cluster bacterium]|nr:aspartate aminotransferase family protein [SAR202 cluster bacterium]